MTVHRPSVPLAYWQDLLHGQRVCARTVMWLGYILHPTQAQSFQSKNTGRLNVIIVKLLTRRITALPGLQQYHSVAACCIVPYQAILTASCSTDQWFASTWSKQSELRAVAFAASGK